MTASLETLCRRACYGGRKGRSALRRLKAHHAPDLERAAESYFSQFFGVLDAFKAQLREVAARMPELHEALDQLSARLASEPESNDGSSP